MKRVPYVWWDFLWENGNITAIRIESDHPKYRVIGDIRVEGKPLGTEIQEAQAVISSIKEGRLSFKDAVKSLAERSST